ncbi:MAG: RDD family protein [Bacilli bacterium]|jgi:uncharacterized RDD family membrane protein YckC
MEIARYEKRVIAYLIDLLIAFAPPLVVAFLLYFHLPDGPSVPLYFYFLVVEIATYLLYIVFTFIFSMISRGFTLGSLIMGIKIMHPNRLPVTAREAFIRGVTIGLLPMVIVNAIYMISIHTERTIFDRITETVVVDYRHR